ncbi:hypothetical protein TWF696_000703 [Orbilia brochopaga]|uniref:PITH domain-containing protein n=1 Tax=Orbilia brochopaga TaxID=3140254 RepID=A0AAV9VC45_9PEZI
MSCHHEHSHGGDGDGHGHGHGHDHSHDDDVTPAIQSSLYSCIDFDAVTTMNEAEEDSGKRVLQKTWEERLSTEPELASDADQELLMFVPFAGVVRLHSILIRAPPDGSAPQSIKLYINRNDLDFSSAESTTPTATIDVPLVPAAAGGAEVTEIPLRRALFNSVRSLTLFFEQNHSGGEEETTRLWYLGFRGDYMKVGREPIITLYEAAANPRDHANLVPGGKLGNESQFGA